MRIRKQDPYKQAMRKVQQDLGVGDPKRQIEKHLGVTAAKRQLQRELAIPTGFSRFIKSIFR